MSQQPPVPPSEPNSEGAGVAPAEGPTMEQTAERASLSAGALKCFLDRHARQLCDDCSQPRTARVHTHRKTKGYHIWRPPLAAGNDAALAVSYYEMDPEQAQAHWEIATRGFAPDSAMGMLAFLSLIKHAARFEMKLLGGEEAERHLREGHAGGYQYLVTDKTGEHPPSVMWACARQSTSRRSKSQVCQVCQKRAHQYLCDHPTDAPCSRCRGRTEAKGFHVCRHCLGSGKEPCSKRLCKGCTRTNGLKEGDINRVDYCDEHAAAHGFKPPASPALCAEPQLSKPKVKCARCRDTKRVWDSSGLSEPKPEAMADEQIPCPSCCSPTLRPQDFSFRRAPYEVLCDRCLVMGAKRWIGKGEYAAFVKARGESYCEPCGTVLLNAARKALASRA